MNVDYIISKYLEKNKDKDEKNRFLQYHFFRPISFYVSHFLMKSDITANQATYISILFGFCGLLFLTFGGYWNRIGGMVFLHFWLIMDNVDGNIARCQDTCTLYGKLIDILNDQVFHFLFFCLGVGLFIKSDLFMGVVGRFSGVSSHLNLSVSLIILGAWASMMSMMAGLVYQKFLSEFGKDISFDLDSKKIKGGTVSRIKLFFYLILRSSDTILPIFIVACVMNYSSLLLVLYALLNTILLFSLVFKFIQMVRNYEGVN